MNKMIIKVNKGDKRGVVVSYAVVCSNFMQ